jgi:adenylate cyclase
MGRNEEAELAVDRGIQLAREHNKTETLGFAYNDAAMISYYAGDAPRALANARQAVEIAEKIGSAFSGIHAYAALGKAQMVNENWAGAVEALERTIRLMREQRAAEVRQAEYLAWLAEAYLGSGEISRARATAEEAVALTKERGVMFQECLAQIILARVLLGAEGADAQARIEAALQRGLNLVEETGGAMMEPFIRIELAELARLTGDPTTRERELREAHRLFTEMKTPIRAAQVEALIQESRSEENST